MSGSTPLRRFLLLVLLPALATCIGLSRVADETRAERRDAVLSRAGGMLSTAVQSDLAEAWNLLEMEAAPVLTVDTTIGAVRRALGGDTVRALGTDRQGPRASVLFPRDDTLVSASAIVRSPVVAAVPENVPLDVALYLQGVRLQPPVVTGGTAQGIAVNEALPDRIAPRPGWDAEAGLWLHPATASQGSAAGDLVVALRPAAPLRGSTSLRTLLSAALVLLMAVAIVASGARGGSSMPAGATRAEVTRAEAENRRGRVIAGVTLAVLATAVISISIALGAERRAEADEARELEIVAGLVEARGLTDDPVGAQRWAGSPVYAVRDGSVVGGAATPPPPIVTELEPPAPGRPTTGSGDVSWRAVTTTTGYTVFLGEPARTPPLLLLALAGTLLTLVGAVGVVRTT